MFGGNVGDTVTRFREAATRICETIGPILTFSGIYKSEPWGFVHQTPFLNQAVIVETDLSPEAVLTAINGIENDLGRKRTTVNGPRAIDIDILFFDDAVVNLPNLEIPHPRMHLRNFNLIPLNEIAAGWINPVTGKTVHDMMIACEDLLYVEKTTLTWN